MKTPTPLELCRTALARSLAAANPLAVLDSKGYVGDASLNLVDGLALADVEADLRQGDGNELGGKFRAAYSSSALVINTFAPFKNRPAELKLPWGDGFSLLNFEQKCPHGIPGRRSPNLDLIARSAERILAVESKCLEFLEPHVAVFAPIYQTAIDAERQKTVWFAEMQRLIREPRHYRWLDAAQLVKHALGLLHTFPNHQRTLVYLFWEPSNPGVHSVFAEHRAEIDRFAESICSDSIAFVSMSYPELWKYWETNSPASDLLEHVARLRARYGVLI